THAASTTATAIAPRRAHEGHGWGREGALISTNASPNPIAIRGGSRVATNEVSPAPAPPSPAPALASGCDDWRERNRAVSAPNPRRITRRSGQSPPTQNEPARQNARATAGSR